MEVPETQGPGFIASGRQLQKDEEKKPEQPLLQPRFPFDLPSPCVIFPCPFCAGGCGQEELI